MRSDSLPDLRAAFDALDRPRRRAVQLALCQHALGVWEAYLQYEGPFAYVDAVIGLAHSVDGALPRDALASAAAGVDQVAVAEVGVPPIGQRRAWRCDHTGCAGEPLAHEALAQLVVALLGCGLPVHQAQVRNAAELARIVGDEGEVVGKGDSDELGVIGADAQALAGQVSVNAPGHLCGALLQRQRGEAVNG